MTDLQPFINQAWTDHADDPPAVAMRLQQVLDSVLTEDDLIALARLAHHVYGEHLAAWGDGLKYLAALARGPAFSVHGSSGQALRRLRASLGLACGESDVRGTLGPGDRITVSALTAAALAMHDTARATQLLQEALAEADTAALADTDPAARALAVAGNNLAATLEVKAGRSAAERELMILAAQAARRWWQRAGSWLETERAELRLALTWLAAGDPAQARQHALACLAIVDAQAEVPALERFYGLEALALAERAAGNASAQAQALAAMRLAHARLSADDQRWCQANLDKLAA